MSVEFRLEVVVVPVSDVDRAKRFYGENCGFTVDHDHTGSPGMRVVQLTPPGSACSIAIGTGMPEMEPGSLQGLQLVVTDIEAARAELAGRGVDVTEVEWLGPADRPQSRFAFFYFNDPDGNGWAVQEIPA
jgi:catechol 2,3-dioxygenase-like lactoylglutathione lyase family enzyme